MKQQLTYTLPTELAPYFINGDESIFDYIDDAEYEKCVRQFLADLDYDGLAILDVVNDSQRFVKYHDLADYGVLATECSDYVVV